jgi:hypothetical protein
MRWIIPIGTALWAFWRWSEERKQTRIRERDRISALYVNPFLSACEDLESRIYNLLELNGLDSLRKRYPDHGYADETLYLIVRYFGWVASVWRYGPYTQDSEVIRLTEAIRNDFATTEYPVGPFAFFRPEQKALGKLVMQRFEGQYGIEMDTIPLYEFKKQLKAPPLSESESIKQSLKALKEAKSSRTLKGRQRLIEAQIHLVDLLSYLESKMGISLFPGERKKCSRKSRPQQRKK